MKTLALLLLPLLSLAQVGIGNTNPQATIHVSDDGMPERMILENIPYKPNASMYLVIEGNAVGWNDGSNLIVRPNITNITEVPGVGVDIFSNTSGAFNIQDIPLVSVSVNIQPNSTSFFVLTYSVPVGVISGNNQVGTDIGINFYRNGVLYDWVSNEQTLATSSNPSSRNGITYIDGTYYEAIINGTSSTVMHTFTIEGWIDQLYSGDSDTVYRFWDDMHMTYQSTNYQN